MSFTFSGGSSSSTKKRRTKKQMLEDNEDNDELTTTMLEESYVKETARTDAEMQQLLLDAGARNINKREHSVEVIPPSRCAGSTITLDADKFAQLMKALKEQTQAFESMKHTASNRQTVSLKTMHTQSTGRLR